MNSDSENTWRTLLRSGLVAGSMPPATGLESPWYVRLMLGAAGWIAAGFLLGFVATGLAWIISSELASTLAGALMMAAALLLLRKLTRNDFAIQFALAVSFAGQVLFAVGIFGWLGLERDTTFSWAVMTVTEVLLAALMPNATHRLWSAFAAAVAFYLVLYSLHLAFIAPAIVLAFAAWTWLNEFAWPGYSCALRPMAYGLVLALVAIDMATGVLQPLTGMGVSFTEHMLVPSWTGQLLRGVVVLSVVWALLRRGGAEIPGRVANAALLGSVILVGASLEAPGISVGVCIILLGYAHGNRLLTGLGVTALLLYLGTYYYSLADSLLVKSQTLAVSGAVLLTLRWLLLHWLLPDAEPVNE